MGWIGRIFVLAAIAAFATKETPPVRLAMGFQEKNVKPGTTVTVVLSITPTQPIEHASVQFEKTGEAAFVNGDAQRELKRLRAGESHTASIQVKLPNCGKTEIRAKLQSLDPEGTILFGQVQTFYVLVSKATVLSGASGFIHLEIENLDRRKKAGEISAAEYDSEVKKLLGGGAKTDATEVHPNAKKQSER